MVSEIQARLNRQGWRIIAHPGDSAHPRIDHRKRRIHADNPVDLARAYLELRGWKAPQDFADHVAQTRAVNYWLELAGSPEMESYPAGVDQVSKRLVEWVATSRVDLIPEIAHCHESFEHVRELADRLRHLLAQPHLLTDVKVRHSFRALK